MASSHEMLAATQPLNPKTTHGGLPNVIVIGAMKCGSTSLHNYLDAHPQIAMSEKKELNFFYRPAVWSKGVDWYRKQFSAEVPVRGESSVNYTKNPAASRLTARRMQRLMPDVKLIYLVRHPIDRAVSHYLHTHAAGHEDRSLSEALSDLDGAYVSRGLYYTNLKPFLHRFPAASLVVVPQERLRAQRAGTLELIFSFLGVDPAVDAPEFSTMWQTAASKLEPHGADPEADPTAAESATLDAALRAKLTARFKPDFKRIRRLMAPELRRGWRL